MKKIEIFIHELILRLKGWKYIGYVKGNKNLRIYEKKY